MLPQRPRAIVVVTAHWQAPAFTVGSSRQPAMLYDYHGFPPHTYAVRYDAEKDALIGAGVHMNRTYAENGNIAAEEIVFEDGPVEFRLDENGFLLWIDQVENAGDGMAFEPVEIYEF